MQSRYNWKEFWCSFTAMIFIILYSVSLSFSSWSCEQAKQTLPEGDFWSALLLIRSLCFSHSGVVTMQSRHLDLEEGVPQRLRTGENSPKINRTRGANNRRYPTFPTSNRVENIGNSFTYAPRIPSVPSINMTAIRKSLVMAMEPAKRQAGAHNPKINGFLL